MRKEHIKYLQDLPLNFSIVEVENYPLHWHDSIQIVLVLEGSIDIEIGTEFYYIEKGEIEIVNPNEIHSIKKNSNKNLVLIMNIDPDFFEKYYKGAKEVFYYADSSDKKIQKTERYNELRKHIAIIYYEVLSHYEDYKETIELKLSTMMYFLLNNFHYLFYEEESLRNDDIELERYHRIVRYITNNYMERVSLQEIADKEFLTSQYLSFKIKNTFGYGFNDFLNLTRVEESIKLLLNTDMNISEISEHVGFSHVRYYNKNFKLHYSITPLQYRKKYQLPPEELEKRTIAHEYPLRKALPYLVEFLETYERYEYDDKIYRYDITLNTDSVSEFSYCKILSLGSIKQIYRYKNIYGIIDLIKSLNFKYALIEDVYGLFDETDEPSTINWYYMNSILDFIKKLDMVPIFLIDNHREKIDILKDYIEKYREDISLSDIIFTTHCDFFKGKENLYSGIDNLNDTLYRVGDIFKKITSSKPQIPKIIDEYQITVKDNDTFYGDEGLLTFNGLKKPSYYSFIFLSEMGDDLILSDDGIIVTRSDKGFEVLLFNTVNGEENKSQKKKKKRYSVNIHSLDQDYRVIRYELNKDSGSVYEKWNYLGRPKYMTEKYLRLLEESAIPEIKFYYAKRSTIYNIFATVRDRGATLYLFRKV